MPLSLHFFKLLFNSVKDARDSGLEQEAMMGPYLDIL